MRTPARCQPVEERRAALALEVGVHRLRHDRTDPVNRLDLLDARRPQPGRIAEVACQRSRRLAAHVADAEADQQPAQRLLLARFQAQEQRVERLLADAVQGQQFLAALR